MMNECAFDVVDKTFYDIVCANNPSVSYKLFGGLTAALGGHFYEYY